MSLSIGTRIRHPQYGDGIILDNAMDSAYNVVFKNSGEKAVGKNYEGLEVIELAPLPDQRLSLGDLKAVLGDVLEKWAEVSEVVPLGSKWKGGTLVLKPADPALKGKEMPIEAFFHKIVMIRDRMRVLEQNLNKSKNLSDEEKVHMQQYITRIYGSLTSFNVLFRHPEDGFKGEGK